MQKPASFIETTLIKCHSLRTKDKEGNQNKMRKALKATTTGNGVS